jgi:formylglycine-generating enzyme required for sulfatase activity
MKTLPIPFGWHCKWEEKKGEATKEIKEKKDAQTNIETINHELIGHENETGTITIISEQESSVDSENPIVLAEEQEEIKPKGLPFPTPAAPALPNKLAISRALRPLMRKVPSPTRSVLDIEATVTRIAEQDIWLPVTQPEPERWLDLELVVEETRSSFIWQETIAELEALLHNHGAFRRFRTWTLSNPETRENSDPKKHPKLTRRKKGTITNYCEHSYRELISSNRRSVIILLSDCVSSIWQQEIIYKWLKTWAEKVPTTIMHLFPEKLWLSSELGFGYKVKFSAFNPGVSNSQLTCNEDFDSEQTLNLPVITLEPEYIKHWAKVIAGFGSSQTPGIVLDLDFVFEQVKTLTPSQPQNSSIPETIVDRFLATASLTAQRLAGLMAAAPVSLPVVHLIQKTLLSKSTPVHVAEVFLSGMIERKKEDEKSSNISLLFKQDKARSKHQYDFVPGFRKLLNQAMPLGETEKVLDVLSEYIAENLGLSIKSFTALLLRQQDLTKEQQEQILPFAHVAIEVLNNLGGEYAEFAQELKQIDFPKFVIDPQLETDTFDVATIEIEETDTQIFEFTVATLERQQSTSQEEQVQWVINREQRQAEGIIEVLAEGIELELMLIPGGTFWMGTPEAEIERLCEEYNANYFRRESPQHKVTVPPFFMGKYQVTQAQWKAIAKRTDLKVNTDLNPDPSYFKEDPEVPLNKGDLGGSYTRWDRPVEQVNWYEAKEFCARLTQLTGRQYRLPTEAEWEYACRAVNSEQLTVNSEEMTVEEWNKKYHQPFHFGETISTELANYNGKYTYRDGVKGEYREQTTPVGYFGVANAFGLYDMHGNVWEWCEDDYHKNYNGAPIDGSAWLTSDKDTTKILRGGSWPDNPNQCRSACRNIKNPGLRSNNLLGFRVVGLVSRTL